MPADAAEVAAPIICEKNDYCICRYTLLNDTIIMQIIDKLVPSKHYTIESTNNGSDMLAPCNILI